MQTGPDWEIFEGLSTSLAVHVTMERDPPMSAEFDDSILLMGTIFMSSRVCRPASFAFLFWSELNVWFFYPFLLCLLCGLAKISLSFYRDLLNDLCLRYLYKFKSWYALFRRLLVAVC